GVLTGPCVESGLRRAVRRSASLLRPRGSDRSDGSPAVARRPFCGGAHDDRPHLAPAGRRATFRRDLGGGHHSRDAVSTTVLHLQKVAGISGSEAHLLSLLPRLKERGWDVRFVMLHEHEPGACDFARELTARGIPLDAIPLAADVDPIAFLRLAARLMRNRPTILHTHLVHADV